MDKSVEKVISAIHEGGDWKTILTSEFRRQGYRQFQYMNRVIKQIVVQNLPIAFFKECLNYVNGDVIGIHDVDWFRHVIRHGTKEYFLFVLEEVEKEDYMIIFEQGVGRDRLAQLLEWLDDLELVADLLKNYVETLNLYVYHLDSGQKEVILTLIEYLQIDAYTYDWGAEDSLVNQWILTLRDQV